MAKKKLLTKLKTKVSTRTALLIALGLVIIGGAAWGIASTSKLMTKTVFNVSDSGIKIGNAPLTMVVYSGQDGSTNYAVPTICKALKDKGVIKYDIDYTKSVAGSRVSKACSQKNWYGRMTGSTTYQAFNTTTNTFFAGSCWGGATIAYYTTVNCAIKTPYVPPYTPPYTRPYTPPYTPPYTYTSNTLDYDYQLIYQAPYYQTMKSGTVQNVSITVMNTGKKTWYNNKYPSVLLGTGSIYGAPNQQRDYFSEFANSDWLYYNRPTAISSSNIQSGQSAKFQFNIKAPNNTGSYKAYFTPVVIDGVNSTWMKDIGIFWQIQVR